MKVLKVHPTGEIVGIEVLEDIESTFRVELGGDIQVLPPLFKSYCMVVNRLGYDFNLLENVVASRISGDKIVGPALILKGRVTSEGFQFEGLSDSEMEELIRSVVRLR